MKQGTKTNVEAWAIIASAVAGAVLLGLLLPTSIGAFLRVVVYLGYFVGVVFIPTTVVEIIDSMIVEHAYVARLKKESNSTSDAAEYNRLWNHDSDLPFDAKVAYADSVMADNAKHDQIKKLLEMRVSTTEQLDKLNTTMDMYAKMLNMLGFKEDASMPAEAGTDDAKN